MAHIITSLLLLFLAGCQTMGAPGNAKNDTATRLIPNTAECFATPTATQFIIGIVGKGWAIQFSVPRDKSSFPTGVLNTQGLTFYRGPEIEKYIRPSAGPPTPPLPKTDAYSVFALTNVTIAAVGAKDAPEPKGYLEITLSRFAVKGEWFTIENKVRLPFRGPYP